ncbi:MAG: phosphonate C-P lyase system protein PhnG, partial [Planctomycetota bacterium]
MNIPREQWSRCLAVIASERLTAITRRLCQGFEIRHRQVPQSGLGMLRLREPSLGDAFNLGEFPLCVVAVDLIDAQSQLISGGCALMSDDLDQAT